MEDEKPWPIKSRIGDDGGVDRAAVAREREGGRER